MGGGCECSPPPNEARVKFIYGLFQCKKLVTGSTLHDPFIANFESLMKTSTVSTHTYYTFCGPCFLHVVDIRKSWVCNNLAEENVSIRQKENYTQQAE